MFIWIKRYGRKKHEKLVDLWAKDLVKGKVVVKVVNEIWTYLRKNVETFYKWAVLLLGYQPLGTEASTHKHYGRLKKYNLREGVAGHIRVFTYRALLELLKDYG